MDDWQAWIGREQSQSDVLTPALLRRFYATIDSDDGQDDAPQGIHWCLCLPDAATRDLDRDGHPKRGGFLPPIALPRRMWASSAVEFHQPIAPSLPIDRKSTIADVTIKQGGSGTLAFVQIDHQTFCDGTLAVSERQTLVYREAAPRAPAQPAAEPTADLSAWPWQRTIAPSEALLFRFSALTFNSHRIHYDQPYAVEEEGYRGLVVHGPLTATLLLNLAARQLGSNLLKRFAFRGVSPAIAGEALHLVGRADGNALTLAALGPDGREIMTATAL
jgi:3-methylfumaryl-CoA hydratase